MNKLKCIFIALLFVGCTDFEKNHKEVRQWINEHKKPIVKEGMIINLMSFEREYTLICKEGHIYQTPRIKFSLPDTLR